MAYPSDYDNWKSTHGKKDFLRKFFQKMGLAVYRHKKSHVYCPERYVVKAMKLVDIEETAGFGELAKLVIEQKKTRLDYGKLYMIYQAVLNVREIPGKTGRMAEIGVYQGGGTMFIASLVEREFKEKPVIHAIDTFEGHHPDDISPDLDGPHRQGKFSDTSFEEVKRYLSSFPNVLVHKGRFQDLSGDIAGEPFSFVHIDVDIYEPTRACLEFFADVLLAGGIMVVDDYGVKTCEGAMQAVDEFAGKRKDFIKYHLETGQCLLIRVR